MASFAFDGVMPYGGCVNCSYSNTCSSFMIEIDDSSRHTPEHQLRCALGEI